MTDLTNRPLVRANVLYDIEVLLLGSGLTDSEKIGVLAEKLHSYTSKKMKGPRKVREAASEEVEV